jgi:hypothetical protein
MARKVFAAILEIYLQNVSQDLILAFPVQAHRLTGGNLFLTFGHEMFFSGYGIQMENLLQDRAEHNGKYEAP